MSPGKFDFGDTFYSFIYEFYKLERLMCEQSGLYSGQSRILTTLMTEDGITLKELARRAKLGSSSLSVSIRNMEKSGLAQKKILPDDHRICLIYLTDKGRSHAYSFHQLIHTYFSELSSSFETNMPASLEEVLERFLNITDSYYEQLK